MTETARLLLLLGLAGTAMTFLGSLALWWFKDERRIRRALRRVLKDEPEAVVIAQGRGRGAGVSFATGLAAVAWDKGEWCLVYRIDELSGAELIVDGQVVARAFRGEPRRALEQTVSSADQVQLRLIFDDPRYPDFELDLWMAGDENRRDDWSPRAAIQEANRWLARAEAILRRPARPRVQPEPAAVAAPPPSQPPQPAPPPRPVARPAPPPPEPEWEDEVEDIEEVEDDEPPLRLEPVYTPKPARLPPAEPAPAPRFSRARAKAPPPWEGEPEFDFGPHPDDERNN